LGQSPHFAIPRRPIGGGEASKRENCHESTVEPVVPASAPTQFADADYARSAALAFDLRQLPADYFANPYPYYHALRDYAPVHRLPDGGYFLSRYADCAAVYKDVTLFSSDKKREFRPKYGDSLLYQHHTTSLVFNDPPLHTRVRKIIAGAFSPRAIAALQQPVIDLGRYTPRSFGGARRRRSHRRLRRGGAGRGDRQSLGRAA
jgi:hypothetical protein